MNITNSTQPPQNSINDLRLPQNFGEQFGVKRILTTVSVGKPPPPRFFRTKLSQEMAFDAYLVEDKVGGGYYVVTAAIAGILGKLARPVRLYAAIDRSDYPFLIPVPLPDDKGLGMYEVFEAEIKLPEPNWPEITMEELVDRAFTGRIVTSADHPMVQGLLGRV